MGASKSLILFLTVCLAFVAANIGVPVLLFRGDSATQDLKRPLAGHTVSTDDFSSTLSSLEKPELSVMFIQDQLSSEDFLRLGKNMQRGGLFDHVQVYASKRNSLFYPSVKSPTHSLKTLVDRYDERIELEDAEQVVQFITDTILAPATVITIHLHATADEENAAKNIAKNDVIVGAVMDKVENSGYSYAAFYTAKTHRKHHEAIVQGVGRHLLQAEELAANTNKSIVLYTSNNRTVDGCMVWAQDVKIKGNAVSKSSKVECTNVANVTMKVKIDIATLTFSKNASNAARGMWKLVKTEIEGANVTISPDISAPHKFSYHCNEGLKFYAAKGNASAVLEFKRLQVQVFDFKKAGKFGDPYDCTGFFTIPLWTGLLLSLFLISVTIYGMMMLNNVQTFDLYDDPKGKPLQVNVSE